MRYDFLATPVSEAEPAGPDLDETLDPDYANIIAEASGIVPTRFYDRAREEVFDRGKIDFSKHEAAITGLLQRSRDLRLLVLDARLQVLAGKLTGFAEALQGMAAIVTTFWDSFYPLPFEGDMIERQNTLEGLDDTAVIIPAIQSAPVLEGRARISYRNYLVAFGKIEPWAKEQPMSRDTVDRALKDKANAPQLETALAAVTASQDALTVLRNIFIDRAGHTSAPAFDKLADLLKNERLFLEDYLGITDAAAQAAIAAELAATSEDGEPSAVSGGAVRPAGPVTSHAAAIAALKAAEDYFARLEPSSPAMILIHQARLLVGRPLVEALEALLPEPSAHATLRFDSGFSFSLDIARMKLVTDDMLAGLSAENGSGSNGYDAGESAAEPSAEETTESSAAAEGDATGDGTAGDGAAPAGLAHPPALTARNMSAVPVFSVANRQEASLLLSAVENFFKLVEPSSPVALLLARARAYVGKDFAAILNELLPPPPPSE